MKFWNSLFQHQTPNASDIELESNSTSYSKLETGINADIDTGWATQFKWSSSEGFWADGGVTPDNITLLNLEIEVSDLFLPDSVWVIMQGSTGAFHMKSANTNWDPSFCLSTDDSECPASNDNLALIPS